MTEMKHALNIVKEATNNGPFFGFLLVSAFLAISGQFETSLFGQYLSYPNRYPRGADIPIWILPMTSIDSQLSLPYDESLFCSAAAADSSNATPPSRWILDTNPALPSPIKVRNKVLTNLEQHPLCQKTFSQEQASTLKNLIENGYNFNVAIDDGLPAAFASLFSGRGYYKMSSIYHGGFPIGFTENSADGEKLYFVFNHWKLRVHVNSQGQVVQFEIKPESIPNHHQHQPSDQPRQDEKMQNIKKLSEASRDLVSTNNTKSLTTTPNISAHQKVTPNETVFFTYQVEIVESDQEWSQRWNVYLTEDHLVPQGVHYYSIYNSVLLMVFFGVVLGHRWTKRLHLDAKLALPLLAQQQGTEPSNEPPQQPENVIPCCPTIKKKKDPPQKWRLLQGDVFRPPSTNPICLVVAIGTGAQILSAVLVGCVACILGIVSPIYKRTFFVGALVSYSLVGSWVGGYVTAKAYQSLQLSDAKQQAIWSTTLFFPGLLSAVFFGVNQWSMNGSSARPLFSDILMVFFAMVVFVYQSNRGADFGFAHPISPYPTATSDVARDIPAEQNMWKRWGLPVVVYFGSGFLLFGILYVENFFLLRFFWHGQFFETYGFLMITIMLMVACSAALSVECTYGRLNQEDYHWWWASFHRGASSGLIFLWYYWSTIHTFGDVQTVGAAVYYYVVTLIVSLGIALSFGFVSFASSLCFVRSIYGSLSDGE